MQKVAVEGEPDYEAVKQKLDAGDKQVVDALSTPAGAEFGWGAIGAGLGAGGGYLVSRWLRRNGTKRQRAMDVLIGALLGGGGTMLALHGLTGPGGLSLAQIIRSDSAGITPEKSGVSAADIEAGRQAWKNRGGLIGLITGLFGSKHLPLKTLATSHRMHTLAQGLHVPDAEYVSWRNTPKGQKYNIGGRTNRAVTGGQDTLATDPTAKLLSGVGGVANTVVGGVGGAYLGNYVGGKAYDVIKPYKGEGTAH
jgi:hypothetical protein